MIETLQKIKKVGNWDVLCYNDKTEPILDPNWKIAVDTSNDILKMKLQTKPTLENGIHGLQIDDLIELCYLILGNFNKGKHYCIENEQALSYLSEAKCQLEKRRLRRTLEGTEGTSRGDSQTARIPMQEIQTIEEEN